MINKFPLEINRWSGNIIALKCPSKLNLLREIEQVETKNKTFISKQLHIFFSTFEHFSLFKGFMKTLKHKNIPPFDKSANFNRDSGQISG